MQNATTHSQEKTSIYNKSSSSNSNKKYFKVIPKGLKKKDYEIDVLPFRSEWSRNFLSSNRCSSKDKLDGNRSYRANIQIKGCHSKIFGRVPPKCTMIPRMAEESMLRLCYLYTGLAYAP